jgi:uncharacterized repeat protein (TIGR03843 family)
MGERADPALARDLLARGEVTLKGRMPRSSNATFLVECDLDGRTALAVYKPERGERPLWDFPPGLYRREIASYRLSEALGWGLVPRTRERGGPYGEGSLQLFVPADFRQHYFTLLEQELHRETLRRICLFDLVINNADRKSGHCLYVPDDRIYAIDNGLSFHAESKLRTVIWDFGEEPIAAEMLEDVRRVLDRRLPPELAELLDADGQRALRRRARGIIRSGTFPVDESGLRYPWPLISPRPARRVEAPRITSHQRRFSSPPASALPVSIASDMTRASSTPSRSGMWSAHHWTSRISSRASASGSQAGQYARAIRGVSGGMSLKTRHHGGERRDFLASVERYRPPVRDSEPGSNLTIILHRRRFAA